MSDTKQIRFYPTDDLIKLPISASAFRTLCRVLERTGGGVRQFYMSAQSGGDCTHMDVESSRRRRVRFQEDLRELEAAGLLRRTGKKVGNGTNCYDVILSTVTGSKNDQVTIATGSNFDPEWIEKRTSTGSKNVPVLDRNPVTIEIREENDLRKGGGERAHAREAAPPPPIEKESLATGAAEAALATARRDMSDETSPTNAIVSHHGPIEAPKVQAPTESPKNAPTGFDALLALHDSDRIPAVSIWQLREAYDEYGEEVIRAYEWGLKNKKERDGLIKYGLSGGSKKTLMEAYYNDCATNHKTTADDETRKVNALYRELDALGGLYFQEYRQSVPTIHYVRANFAQCEKILARLKSIEEDRKQKSDMIRVNIGEFLAKMAG